MRFLFSTLILTMISLTSAYADNFYSDNQLQSVNLSQEADGWFISIKAGVREGSGEIVNDGTRFELPRFSLQKQYADSVLFRATIPYVYLNNDKTNRYTLGDPSFFTTLKTTENSSFTVGVTEPAANRPIEPDVVRFMAFYTGAIPLADFNIGWQLGTEIPDRYNDKGQDDLLSFGLELSLAQQWSASLIRKQVVDGRWWDITKPLDNALNRTNLTLEWHQPVNYHWLKEITLLGGAQFNQGNQWWLGLSVH